MKKIVSVIAAVYILAAFAVPCRAEDNISARSALVMEADTLSILYEKNAEEPMQMASITKVMTALIVLENCGINETVAIKPEYSGVEGSSIYLTSGENVSVETLLYGLMLESGNDAAVALACHTAGSVEAFAELMNERATEIGCGDTFFVNPHGLDAEGHHSTAKDLALIMAEAMKNEDFCRIVSTKDISIGGRHFSNHNKLLWQYEGCIGGKTGYTKSSGRSLVTCAERGGMRLICVTLNDPDDWDDHTALYDRCFSGWKKVIVGGDDYRYKIPVVAGTDEFVWAAPEKSAAFILPADTETEININIEKFLYAPVKKKCPVGTVTVTAGGETLFSTLLMTEKGTAADKSQLLSLGEKIGRYFSNTVRRSFEKLGYEPEG